MLPESAVFPGICSTRAGRCGLSLRALQLNVPAAFAEERDSRPCSRCIVGEPAAWSGGERCPKQLLQEKHLRVKGRNDGTYSWEMGNGDSLFSGFGRLIVDSWV